MKPSIMNSVYAMLLSAVIAGTLPACSSTPTHESTGEYIDDAAITTKVKASLIDDSLTQSAGFEVQTHKGMVQLSGFADNDKQRIRAAMLALKVPGVKTVRNDIVLE